MTPHSGEPEQHEFAFASFDSLEGVPVMAPAPAGTPGYLRLYRAAQRIMPGGLIAVVVALAATWLADHYGAPVMLFALLLGMAVNFVGQDPRCRPGIDFMGRTVLRLGVALLGARITLDQVSSLGFRFLDINNAVTASAAQVAFVEISLSLTVDGAVLQQRTRVSLRNLQ